MAIVSVVDAATELGVSERRVRQMLAEGAIVGHRIGRTWAIDTQAIRSADTQRRQVGRPWSTRSAWAVLALADGSEPNLSPVERSRAKKRLAQGLPVIAHRLSVRAERRTFYAHPGVFDRLAAEPAVVRSGVSAVGDHDVDLIAREDCEVYVKRSAVDALVDRFRLEERSNRPNVILRVVDEDVWPFIEGQRVASAVVVAMDLLDSGDARSMRAGVDLLNRA